MSLAGWACVQIPTPAALERLWGQDPAPTRPPVCPHAGSLAQCGPSGATLTVTTSPGGRRGSGEARREPIRGRINSQTLNGTRKWSRGMWTQVWRGKPRCQPQGLRYSSSLLRGGEAGQGRHQGVSREKGSGRNEKRPPGARPPGRLRQAPPSPAGLRAPHMPDAGINYSRAPAAPWSCFRPGLPLSHCRPGLRRNGAARPRGSPQMNSVGCLWCDFAVFRWCPSPAACRARARG